MATQQQTAINYSLKAEQYEKRWKKYLNHTHNALLSQFSSGPEDRILDISAGTGLLATQLIQKGFDFDEIILNDISEGMLKVACDRINTDHKVSMNLHEATDLQLPRNSVDSVISMSAFHHYAKQKEVVREVFRVLKPGGRLYLLDWDRSGFFRVINKIAAYWSDDLTDTRSLDETTQMLRQKRFQIGFKKDWYWWYWRFFLIVAEKP